MAFVYRQERTLNQTLNDLPQHLGPGTYVGHKDYTVTRSAAPFNTQVSRSVPKKESEITPGPGAYQFEPTQNGQKVVLQSGNSDVKILEVPKPQSNFKSQTKRFINQRIEDVPGPGTYVKVEVDNKLKRPQAIQQGQGQPTIIDHLMRVNRYQSIPSIPHKHQVYGYSEKDNNELELNKNPEHMHLGINKNSVGPGQYNLKNTFEVNKNKGTQWYKSKVAKLANTVSKEKEQMAGPGTYDNDSKLIPLYKLRPSVGFQSKSQRIFDQNKGQVAQQFIMQRLQKNQQNFSGFNNDNEGEEVEFVEDTTPGPGQYFQNSMSTATTQSQFIKYKQDAAHAFGSQSKRFGDEMKVQNVGPGNYNVSSMTKSAVTFKQPPFLSSNTRFDARIMEKRPGPQSYNPKQTLEDKLIQKIQKGPLGNFGSNLGRFKQESQLAEQMPGPGQYEHEVAQEKSDIITTQSIFKSKSVRDAFQIKKEQIPPPGAYVVENYTIGKAVKIEQEDDPDLAIKKPPFNSGLPRFKEQVVEEVDENDDTVTGQNNERFNQLFMKKPVKDAAFNIKSKRFNYQQSKDQPPGPGQYHEAKSNTWNKRTYNILFAEI